MEPAQKKVKITDHFRVALKPQNINVQDNFKKLKKHQDHGNKENIQVITISDDEEDEKELQKNVRPLIGKNIIKQDKTEVVSSQSNSTSQSPYNKYIAPPGIHPNVVDHDRFLLSDISCEPHYAWDSFNYDREQELKFRSRKYIESKPHDHKITPFIRARLVDWLVQIQDLFSLYHESLYMAVKIADQYLMRKTVPKPQLQLLYMTSILISAKFDERLPPVEISDLIQQSGGIYSRKQVISFEVDILCTLDFNIRFPLSYGFLRRYARCTRSDQKTLTLARYILERSLLEYDMIEVLESKIAAAALLLAFEMLHIDEAWTETAEFYTGYKQEELYPLLTELNTMISRPTDRKLSTIKNKYRHDVFLSVADIKPLPQI